MMNVQSINIPTTFVADDISNLEVKKKYLLFSNSKVERVDCKYSNNINKI